ncbi:putative phage abortive infection protein [Aeromonas veronii]|uniref:putative phage abortive infection protein n=1 Tax=Aeromonas veronii TaxID=654 RepID=UPI0030054EA6
MRKKLKEYWLNTTQQWFKLIDGSYGNFDKMFKEEDEQSKSSLNYILFNVLAAALCFGVVAFLINIALIFFTERGGVFGDFLGGVLNPIFTFLTLFGLITTIVIQRRELKLAREEYEKTADALEMQAIEGTFFNIINLHHKIADSIKLDIQEFKNGTDINHTIKLAVKAIKNPYLPQLASPVTTYEGREAFEGLLKYLTQELPSPDEIVEKYKHVQNKHNHIFGHYFRNLYQALKLIHSYDDKILPQERKRKYASILRAQLSTMELALLFINCLDGVSDDGKFKNLLIEYQMLEHLPIKEVDGGFALSGFNCSMATDEMFMQYKKHKNIEISIRKYFRGAFGENENVPYNLKVLP